MMSILVQTGLKNVVTEKKHENLNQTEWEELDELLMEKTSSTLWKMLETLYVTKSLANLLVLKQRLFTFLMNKCELLIDHISQFNTLLNDLKNVE
ncbi:hypothetical protein Goarm_017007, partial [Gossypium armourianum]|nr:hypothetical protein [Gossypium armourianum]